METARLVSGILAHSPDLLTKGTIAGAIIGLLASIPLTWLIVRESKGSFWTKIPFFVFIVFLGIGGALAIPFGVVLYVVFMFVCG